MTIKSYFKWEIVEKNHFSNKFSLLLDIKKKILLTKFTGPLINTLYSNRQFLIANFKGKNKNTEFKFLKYVMIAY